MVCEEGEVGRGEGKDGRGRGAGSVVAWPLLCSKSESLCMKWGWYLLLREGRSDMTWEYVVASRQAAPRLPCLWSAPSPLQFNPVYFLQLIPGFGFLPESLLEKFQPGTLWFPLFLSVWNSKRQKSLGFILANEGRVWGLHIFHLDSISAYFPRETLLYPCSARSCGLAR